MSMPLAGSDYRSTTTKYMSPISAARSVPAVYAKHAGDRSGGERYLAVEEATNAR